MNKKIRSNLEKNVGRKLINNVIVSSVTFFVSVLYKYKCEKNPSNLLFYYGYDDNSNVGCRMQTHSGHSINEMSIRYNVIYGRSKCFLHEV